MCQEMLPIGLLLRRASRLFEFITVEHSFTPLNVHGLSCVAFLLSAGGFRCEDMRGSKFYIRHAPRIFRTKERRWFFTASPYLQLRFFGRNSDT